MVEYELKFVGGLHPRAIPPSAAGRRGQALKGAAILLADPYISHQYSGERVGGGVPDAPFFA